MINTDTLRDAIAAKSDEYGAASQAVAAAKHNAAKVQGELTALKAALNDVRAREIVVSDHAVLRYAERALGLDANAIRMTIAAQVAPLAHALGDGTYPVDGECKAVVKNRVVVSIVPAK